MDVLLPRPSPERCYWKANNLRNFISAIKAELQKDVAEDDREALIEMMSNIREVRRRMDETKDMLVPLKSTVHLLKQHKVDIEDEVLEDPRTGETEKLMDFLDAAELKWDSLVNFTFSVKEQILPLQTAEIERLRASVETFASSVSDFIVQFKDPTVGAPFSFSGSCEEAFKLIENQRNLYSQKKKRADELNALEELFEINATKWRTLLQADEEMNVLKKIWEFRANQQEIYSSWNDVAWADIDTDELEVQNRKLQKELKQLGAASPICRGWTVSKSIEKQIKDMGIVVPLVSQLTRCAPREALERQWPAAWRRYHTIALRLALPMCLHYALKIVQRMLRSRLSAQSRRSKSSISLKQLSQGGKHSKSTG